MAPLSPAIAQNKLSVGTSEVIIGQLGKDVTKHTASSA